MQLKKISKKLSLILLFKEYTIIAKAFLLYISIKDLKLLILLKPLQDLYMEETLLSRFQRKTIKNKMIFNKLVSEINHFQEMKDREKNTMINNQEIHLQTLTEEKILKMRKVKE